MISSPNYLKHRLVCEAIRTGMKIHIPKTLSETIDLLRNIYNQGVSIQCMNQCYWLEMDFQKKV